MKNLVSKFITHRYNLLVVATFILTPCICIAIYFRDQSLQSGLLALFIQIIGALAIKQFHQFHRFGEIKIWWTYYSTPAVIGKFGNEFIYLRNWGDDYTEIFETSGCLKMTLTGRKWGINRNKDSVGEEKLADIFSTLHYLYGRHNLSLSWLALLGSPKISNRNIAEIIVNDHVVGYTTFS